MKSPAPRFLFQCHNRRGLGHLMRGRNIAREIRQLAPSSEILFYTKNDPAALWGEEFRSFIETDEAGLPHWPEAVRIFSPGVVIYDTMLPEGLTREAESKAARQVYIMRRSKESRQSEIFKSPSLDSIDRIIIPHAPDEFGYEVPPAVGNKCVYVGPIVRLPDREIQAKLRKKYRIHKTDFLLTSTVGGGGFTRQADAFFETVFAAHKRLSGNITNLRHLVVLGPNFQKSLDPIPGIEVVFYEPEMMNLFAISNAVIAEGGYNTVNEIRLSKTPAIFLPSDRKFDDQEERVRALEKQGLAIVFPERSDAVSQKIAEVCATGSSLRKIKENLRMDRMEIGNRRAAEEILGLAV